jgi:hypothetical protein
VAEEEQTCGKGLAENSALPAKLGELEAVLAGVLEAHMEALDPSDENSRAEHEVYQRIATGHREAAAQLEGVAREMADQRDYRWGRTIRKCWRAETRWRRSSASCLSGGSYRHCLKRRWRRMSGC